MRVSEIDQNDVRLLSTLSKCSFEECDEALRLCFNDLDTACQYLTQKNPNYRGSRDIYEAHRIK